MSGRKAVAAGRPRGRPPASNGAATRERIIGVARERFATLGYAAASNKDIAEAAGITTGAIYHYFESKRDLYIAVFDQVEALVFSRFNDALRGFEGGFLEKLDRVLDEAVAINDDDPSVTDFFVAVPVEAQRSPDLAGLDRRQGIDAARFFGDLVREGHERGEISADVVPAHVTNALLAITSGLARFSSLAQNRDAHAVTTDVLKRMFRGELFEQPTRQRRRR
jgi:AcrR family transcriptional regulator